MKMTRGYEIMSRVITSQINKEVGDLGVKFQVVMKEKDGFRDILVRIQKDTLTLDNEQAFFKAVNDVILGEYGNDIRFTYPTHIKL